MEKRTIKGLKVIDIDKSQNLIVVKGSIPGKAWQFSQYANWNLVNLINYEYGNENIFR